MIFDWLFKKRRWQRIAGQPFPRRWQEYIDANFSQFAELQPEFQNRIRQRMQIFVAEKYWEGVQGLAVTEEMKVTVAAMACVPTLAFPLEAALYPKVETVLLHEATYERPHPAAGFRFTHRGRSVGGCRVSVR